MFRRAFALLSSYPSCVVRVRVRVPLRLWRGVVGRAWGRCVSCVRIALVSVCEAGGQVCVRRFRSCRRVGVCVVVSVAFRVRRCRLSVLQLVCGRAFIGPRFIGRRASCAAP